MEWVVLGEVLRHKFQKLCADIRGYDYVEWCVKLDDIPFLFSPPSCGCGQVFLKYQLMTTDCRATQAQREGSRRLTADQ